MHENGDAQLSCNSGLPYANLKPNQQVEPLAEKVIWPRQRENIVMRCQLCLKSGMSGNNVSHSNRHTKTRFKANVHKQTLDRDGTPVTVKICSRCLRSLHKSPKVRKAFAALK